ncbi:MAG TPA: hypothetical protein VG537_08520 [Candidatus Kapabacteria bacterium]|jgi:hypothetical protein|nr:hypothetical protein [Candidatus Kapabacteria bacterium]
MTLNERILDFMDGTLPPDDEAELLHSLSVSPEKRDLLRSFMNQKALFVRDRQSIVVPYKAEQALWQRLGAVMPAPVLEVAETAPIAETRALPLPLFSRIFSVASASVGAVALMIGIGAGYFAGMHQSVASNVAASPNNAIIRSLNVPSVVTNNNASHVTTAHSGKQIAQNSSTPNHLIIPANFDWNIPSLNIDEPVAVQSETIGGAPNSNGPEFAAISPRATAPARLDRIGGDGQGNHPLLLHNAFERDNDKTLLQRFEFSIDESFGRQFPNSAATNVSLPLITNSSIGTYFQILPHSNFLWAGASYGTANVTRKDLSTRAGDPTDPLQTVLTSDTIHSQTPYFATFLQCRLPAFPDADLTFTGGYGWATLGQMMMGELGLHYDVSREVGVNFGLRVVRFTYDLTSEKEAAIKSGTGSLVIPNGAADASPSFNTELNTGLYFHF